MSIDPRFKVGSDEWNSDRANEYRKLLNISDENIFELKSYNRNTRHSRDDDEYEFIEKNAKGDVVAIYEAWHRMSIYPPHTPNHGYKKLSPDGKFIEQGSLR